VEVTGCQVQGYAGLHSKLKASLSYMKDYLKNQGLEMSSALLKNKEKNRKSISKSISFSMRDKSFVFQKFLKKH
jgi:hypothetical protein